MPDNFIHGDGEMTVVSYGFMRVLTKELDEAEATIARLTEMNDDKAYTLKIIRKEAREDRDEIARLRAEAIEHVCTGLDHPLIGGYCPACGGSCLIGFGNR